MNNSDTEIEEYIVKRPVGRPRKPFIPKVLKPSGRPKSANNNKYEKKKYLWEVTTSTGILEFKKVKDIAVHFNSSVTSINRMIYENGMIKDRTLFSIKKKDIV